MTPSASITSVLIALLAGGLLAYVRDFAKWAWTARQTSKPDRVASQRVHDSVAQADQSVLVVARARDELEADNARLRAERIEQDARHANERAEWATERAQLRKEIDHLEDQLRSTLAEVQALKARHHMTGPPDAKGGK